MSRVVHFELAADDPTRALKFYEKVLGWTFTKYGEMEYYLVTTGDAGEPGINGALQKRIEAWPALVNTVDVKSLETAVAAVEANGGTVIERRMVIPGVGYLAYVKDTEGNTLGMMQEDLNAKE